MRHVPRTTIRVSGRAPRAEIRAMHPRKGPPDLQPKSAGSRHDAGSGPETQTRADLGQAPRPGLGNRLCFRFQGVHSRAELSIRAAAGAVTDGVKYPRWT